MTGEIGKENNKLTGEYKNKLKRKKRNRIWINCNRYKRYQYQVGWLVDWLSFTACQPIGLFYAEYIFVFF